MSHNKSRNRTLALFALIVISSQEHFFTLYSYFVFRPTALIEPDLIYSLFIRTAETKAQE